MIFFSVLVLVFSYCISQNLCFLVAYFSVRFWTLKAPKSRRVQTKLVSYSVNLDLCSILKPCMGNYSSKHNCHFVCLLHKEWGIPNIHLFPTWWTSVLVTCICQVCLPADLCVSFCVNNALAGGTSVLGCMCECVCGIVHACVLFISWSGGAGYREHQAECCCSLYTTFFPI